MGVGEGTRTKMGGRRNANATVDMWSYEAGQHKQCKNKAAQKMGEIAKNIEERRLNWYGNVMRIEEHNVGRRAMRMKLQGRRKSGMSKSIWLSRQPEG